MSFLYGKNIISALEQLNILHNYKSSKINLVIKTVSKAYWKYYIWIIYNLCNRMEDMPTVIFNLNWFYMLEVSDL